MMSLYKMSECRVCLNTRSNGNLISPCRCKGTIQYVHEKCLETWIYEKYRFRYRELVRLGISGRTGIQCELCKHEFSGRCKYLPLKEILKILCTSQISYYIALNIPVSLYLAFKFQKITRVVIALLLKDLRNLRNQTSMIKLILNWIKLNLRLCANLLPVIIFGTAIPVIAGSTVVLMRSLVAECKVYEIDSYSH